MKYWKYIIFLSIVCMLTTNSCTKTEPECFQPTEVTGKLAFRYYEIKDSVIVVDTGTRDTIIRRQGDTGMPSPILRTLDLGVNYEVRGQRGSNIMTMPLNPDLDRMRYIFKPDTTLPNWDTITMSYNVRNQFINNDCGFTFIYQITNVDVVKTNFDSLEIKDTVINTQGNAQHIQLLFRRN